MIDYLARLSSANEQFAGQLLQALHLDSQTAGSMELNDIQQVRERAAFTNMIDTLVAKYSEPGKSSSRFHFQIDLQWATPSLHKRRFERRAAACATQSRISTSDTKLTGTSTFSTSTLPTATTGFDTITSVFFGFNDNWKGPASYTVPILTGMPTPGIV